MAEEGTAMGGIALLVAILAVLAVVTLFVLRKVFKKDNRNTVVIAGCCASGKTTFFSQLCHQRYVDTNTSMETNEAMLAVPVQGVDKEICVVDVPGHTRLRGLTLDKLASDARAVIFLIDSATAKRDIRPAAEFLYDLLATPALRTTAFLIYCNKQDISFSADVTSITELLEKELGELRQTRGGSLNTTGADAQLTTDTYLGNKDQPFEFAHVEQRVDFVKGSVKNVTRSKVDMHQVTDWLVSILG